MIVSTGLVSSKLYNVAGIERAIFLISLLIGVLFSSIAMVEASCSLLASVIYNALYPATRHITPGFSFFVMAATLTIPFTLIL